MVFKRSSVIDMEAMMASIFLAVSAGMIPSQATGVISHSSFASAQIAPMISTSQPTHAPEASGEANADRFRCNADLDGLSLCSASKSNSCKQRGSQKFRNFHRGVLPVVFFMKRI